MLVYLPDAVSRAVRRYIRRRAIMATKKKMTQTVIEAGKFYTLSAANGKVM